MVGNRNDLGDESSTESNEGADQLDQQADGTYSEWMEPYFLECKDKHFQRLRDTSSIISSAKRITITTTNRFDVTLNIEKCQAIGSIICRCKKLEYLGLLGGDSLSKEMMMALFQENEDPSKTQLLVLDVSENYIGSVGMEGLLPFIKSQEMLPHLILNMTFIGNEGCVFLAEALDHVPIEHLTLLENDLVKDGISVILSSNHSTSIKFLNLSENDLGLAEIEEIAGFLSRDDITLKSLHIVRIETSDFEMENIDWLEILVSSLHTNKSLETIRLPHDLPQGSERIRMQRTISSRVNPKMMALLCNTSTFDDFCESNHVLKRLDTESENEGYEVYEASPEVNLALKINENEDYSKNQKLRLKMRSIYFRQDVSIEPFLQMKPVWMPYVLEMLTISDEYFSVSQYGFDGVKRIISREGNLNGAYRFIRHWNIPQLFPFPSPKTEMKKLRDEVSRLKYETLRIEQLESDVARLEEENKQLTSIIEEYELKCGDSPNKRPKKTA